MEFELNISRKAGYTILAVLIILALGAVSYASFDWDKGQYGARPNYLTGHGGDEILFDMDGEYWTLQEVLGNMNFDVAYGYIDGKSDSTVDIEPLSGYDISDCVFFVSSRDDHKITVSTCNLTGTCVYDGDGFGDWTQFNDNHYGGTQAFFEEDYDANKWKVTCRYLFANKNDALPGWIASRCNYLMLCKPGGFT